MSVLIETTIGDIIIDLFTKERPRACQNFLKLCKIKYYNFVLFHSVQRNFIAQTGDPTGSGRGGESIFSHLYGEQATYFESEKVPKLKHTKMGTVSMVNNGQDMHGSQFLITLRENTSYLDGVHTVFGVVAEGLDVLEKLSEAICDEEFKPYQDIRITHTIILDDPYDDPEGLVIPDRSPEPTADRLKGGRIGADEEIDKTKGKSLEEIEEEIERKEAKARATILEMVGDIPDSEIKPPENVLFVCKLNPVTTDEDLEIIFSRFGKIISCEIIRDKVSGESLQYGFIEFEEEKDCENAYFKMDNVLIDDRRIHVDFSQSVAKLAQDAKFMRNLKKKEADKNKLAFRENKPRDEGKYKLLMDDEVDSTPRHEKQRKRDSCSSDDEDSRRKKKRRKHSRSSIKDKRDRYSSGDRRDVGRDRSSHRYKSRDYDRSREKRRRDRSEEDRTSTSSSAKRSDERRYKRHRDSS